MPPNLLCIFHKPHPNTLQPFFLHCLLRLPRRPPRPENGRVDGGRGKILAFRVFRIIDLHFVPAEILSKQMRRDQVDDVLWKHNTFQSEVPKYANRSFDDDS